jgi:hypothetical protein
MSTMLPNDRTLSNSLQLRCALDEYSEGYQRERQFGADGYAGLYLTLCRLMHKFKNDDATYNRSRQLLMATYEACVYVYLISEVILY